MADQPIIPEQQQQQLNIELTEEMAEGTYANLAIITHSFAEFVIDYVNVMPNAPKAKVKSRVIMTPQHAKRLMKALIDNVKRFEAQYGNIKDQEATAMPFNFGAPTAQA
jgi:3-methyladenine DNA glycosylase Tag